ncbi:MAG: exodeoxyribonuclease VII small subunit [Acidobacteria bacterium]|nr:exodeoxyribonuclease VII small subunit [Acidobacteriota bacterium]
MENIKFEEAMQKLEEIVNKLEGGKVPLDDSLKLFEEGMKLAKFCDERLKDAESKLTMLVKKNGEMIEEPFK